MSKSTNQQGLKKLKESRQLEVLYQISKALVGKQDLDAILYQVVNMTADLAGSKI